MYEVVPYLPEDGLVALAGNLGRAWWGYPAYYRERGISKSEWLRRERASVVEEIEREGGHAVMNQLRGLFGKKRGVGYAEIVRDIAEKQGVSAGAGDPTAKIEKLILLCIWNNALERLRPSNCRNSDKPRKLKRKSTVSN
jgi:hypothetical protein